MSAPWMAAVISLWVLFVVLALVVIGVLRRVVAALETLSESGSFSTRELAGGPPVGSSLPAMELRGQDGGQLSLAELSGPFVLAVLTSHCAPCLGIAERLRAGQDTMSWLDGVVVVTDPEGPARLDLPEPVTVLVDPQSQVVATLQLPGTPFVIAVGADGTVQAAQLLAGPEQMVSLLDSVRLTHAPSHR